MKVSRVTPIITSIETGDREPEQQKKETNHSEFDEVLRDELSQLYFSRKAD